MLHFDPTISVGTLLNILSMFAAGFLLWHKIDIRLSRHDYILEGISNWKKEIDDTKVHFNGETVKRIDLAIADVKREVADYHRRVGSLEHKVLILQTKNGENE